MAVQQDQSYESKIADALEHLPKESFFLNRVEMRRVHDMLGAMAISEGDKILHFGTSYGWLPAIMARLTGEKGIVVAAKNPVEISFAEDNCNRYGVANVRFCDVADEMAWASPAPYTKILFDSADQQPDFHKLGSLLVDGGKIIVQSLGIVNRFNPSGVPA